MIEEYIKKKDGQNLFCRHVFFNHSDHVVLLLHGLEANISNYVVSQKEAAKNELNSFAYDRSGSGRSEGDFSDQTITLWIEELKEVYTHLKNKSYPKISIFGSSMGGLIALAAISEGLDVYKLILRGVPLNIPEILKRDTAEVISLKSRLSEKFLEDAENYDLTKRIRTITCPTLIIHGREDSLVPFEHAEKIFETITGYRELLGFPDSGHDCGAEKYGKEQLEYSLNFLKG